MDEPISRMAKKMAGKPDNNAAVFQAIERLLAPCTAWYVCRIHGLMKERRAEQVEQTGLG